jgi:transcriptional regulator of acetoin/glycerol metabolism
MSWQAMILILRAEVPDHAAVIEAKIRAELSGCRISIPPIDRPTVTTDDIRREVRRSGGNVTAAAQRLGISVSTCYRHLRPPQRQQHRDDGPRLLGRIVR